MMGDGMVSQGSMIVKPNALKLRRIVTKSGKLVTDGKETDNVTLVGFAGSTADAFTLLERLEGKLDEYPGQLARSCVELAKGWRTDKYLRRLEASLIVADATCSLELTGNGDVLESHDGVLGVGSGSPYAIGMFVDCRDGMSLCRVCLTQILPFYCYTSRGAGLDGSTRPFSGRCGQESHACGIGNVCVYQ
jgi:ATP-dependent protease HslVU peptidase subunit